MLKDEKEQMRADISKSTNMKDEQTQKQKDRQTDLIYQVHYLPASRSTIIW